MAQPPLIAESERRAWSYWFVDGLQNLVAGVTCMVLAEATIVLAEHRGSRSPWIFIVGALAVALLILVFVRLKETTEWLKRRITYPRTGYAAPPYFVEEANAPRPADLVMLNLSGAAERQTSAPLLRREDLRWRLLVMLIVVIGAPLTGWLVHSHIICGVIGCCAGIGGWALSRNDPRKSWAVVFGLLFALVFTLNFGTLEIEGEAYFLAGVGFSFAMAGAIVLARYLRRNPVARA